jgi:ADP-dependent NAD(P)H-hydrate dehydratase / NAD(P)H-hydrate epimerase
MLTTHPVLTCAESAAWEEKLLGTDTAKTWAAMERAGCGVGRAALRDYLEIRTLPDDFRVLVLLGTGHNAGDALVAARTILETLPHASITAALLYPREKLRPLALRALEAFEAAGKTGNRAIVSQWSAELAVTLPMQRFNLCIEGVVGMQMTPPLRAPAPEVFAAVSSMDIEMRAAVDLPAGLGDECAPGGFRADFTYATGIAKKPVFDAKNVKATGRVRYIDIGFFDGPRPDYAGKREILPPQSLARLCSLRPATADKRSNGHVFIVGGSHSMPGAVSMATMAAVRSGAGLVTTFVPSSISPIAVAAAPEAMWVPLPIEEADVSASLEAVRNLSDRMTAMVIGPGLDAADWNVRYFAATLIRESKTPLVIDASALVPETMEAVAARPLNFPPTVLTPHLGEFARIAGKQVLEPDCDIDAELAAFSRSHRCVTLLKGPVTRISDGKRLVCGSFGGPVLSRGGSGDILSGILGALASQPGADLFECACLAALWHGAAAEHLARTRGQRAVRTTEILDHLSPASRES